MPDLQPKSLTIGRKETLGNIAIPLDAKGAHLELDSSWHTDPESIAAWGLEISEDSGQTWRHWCTGTRPGGPAVTDGGKPINVFDMEVPVIKGAIFRPFIGVLQGVSSAAVPVTGSVEFK